MRPLLSSLAIMALSSTALADEVIKEFDTHAGHLVLSRTDGTNYQLRVGEKVFEIPASLVTISQPNVEGFNTVFDDTFLIWKWGGGSACYGSFIWLNANETPAKLTEPFGRCADNAGNIRLDGSTVAFELPGFGNEGTVSFIYDGTTVVEEIQGLENYDIVDNPYDPHSWIDESAYNYLRAPQNESFLLDMMSWEELAAVRQAPTVGSEDNRFSVDGDWIVASGCTRTRCNEGGAVVAISKETAMPFIAHIDWNQDWKFYGEVPDRIPNSVRTFMSQY